MINRKKLLLLNKKSRELKSELFGDSYWVNTVNTALNLNTKFSARSAFTTVWDIGDEAKICIKIPSGQPSDELTSRKINWRTTQNDTVSLGTRDRGGIINWTVSTPAFTQLQITNIKGEDLSGDVIPYDEWLIITYICNRQDMTGNTALLFTPSALDPNTSATYYLRGVVLKNEVFKASDIDINNKTWVSSTGQIMDFSNSPNPLLYPEVINIKV